MYYVKFALICHIQRKQLLKKESSKFFCSIKFGVPEVKVFLLLSYYVVFGIMAVVALSINVRNSEFITETLLEYIICQVVDFTNVNSCTVIRDEIESHLQIELNSATYIMMGLLPWVILLLAVQFTDVKTALRSAYKRFSNDKRASTTNAR